MGLIFLTVFSIRSLYDGSVYTKYILTDRSFGEEYIKHHKSTLTVGGKILA